MVSKPLELPATPLPRSHSVRKPGLGAIKRHMNLIGKTEDDQDDEDEDEYVDEDEEITSSWMADIELLRIKVEVYMEHSFFGFMHYYIFMFLSVMSSSIYILSTYINEYDPVSNNVLDKIELVVTSLFVADWFLYLFIAEQKLKFCFSFYSIVDLLTILSVFSTAIFSACPDYSNIDNFISGLYYVACGLGTTRILRTLRLRKQLSHIEDEVQQFLYNMLLDIIVMILFNSAVMQYLESHINQLPFNDWMYYTVITITTVGYGDISPSSVLGRLYCMAMVLFAIISVPKATNELIEKMKHESIYHRASYRKISKSTYHILVCGDMKSSHIFEFFEELFHVDHDTKNLNAVVLQPEFPNSDFLKVMKHKTLGVHITYLEGNPLKNGDLHRAMASEARAIFIMTNNFSPRPDDVDAKTILQQLCIQKYLRLNGDGKINAFFCMQLIRPENKRHLVHSADLDQAAIVVCLNEIKMGVIAKAACYPGTNTLLMNLCSSFSDEKQDEKEREKLIRELEKDSLGIETLEDDEISDWIGEYSRGCDWEIYTTSLSSVFEGTSFCQLSEILYSKLGILLFGLEIEDLKSVDGHGVSRILLNRSFIR